LHSAYQPRQGRCLDHLAHTTQPDTMTYVYMNGIAGRPQVLFRTKPCQAPTVQDHSSCFTFALPGSRASSIFVHLSLAGYSLAVVNSIKLAVSNLRLCLFSHSQTQPLATTGCWRTNVKAETWYRHCQLIFDNRATPQPASHIMNLRLFKSLWGVVRLLLMMHNCRAVTQSL
jgi:hypothetical protein